MTQPPATAVDPLDPTQTRGGKPATQDDLPGMIIDLQNRVSKLESSLSVNVWHPFKYATGVGTGGWSDYDTTGTWGPAGWLQDATGFIHFRGLVKNANQVVYASGRNIIIATGLPAPEQFEFGIGMFLDTAGHNGLAQLNITSSGILEMATQDWTSAGNDGLYLYMNLFMKPYKAITQAQ